MKSGCDAGKQLCEVRVAVEKVSESSGDGDPMREQTENVVPVTSDFHRFHQSLRKVLSEPSINPKRGDPVQSANIHEVRNKLKFFVARKKVVPKLYRQTVFSTS